MTVCLDARASTFAKLAMTFNTLRIARFVVRAWKQRTTYAARG